VKKTSPTPEQRAAVDLLDRLGRQSAAVGECLAEMPFEERVGNAITLMDLACAAAKNPSDQRALFMHRMGRIAPDILPPDTEKRQAIGVIIRVALGNCSIDGVVDQLQARVKMGDVEAAMTIADTLLLLARVAVGCNDVFCGMLRMWADEIAAEAPESAMSPGNVYC
jgi:hypothetical protein